MTTYDDSFYDYINFGATRSAGVVLPYVIDALNIESILDVGCGQGAWLAVWEKLGVADVVGVDGSYVVTDKLLIDSKLFQPSDLSESFNLDRQFDLVQSLEVAEHIPADKADLFVENLVSHGKMILFSAAAVGQGGDHHINEQEYDYWRDKFAKHNYEAYDFIRPHVSGNLKVEPWYRYNTFLYIAESERDSLSEKVALSKVAIGSRLKDISPPLYKARKYIIRLLPYGMKNWLAKINEKRQIKIRLQKGDAI